MIKIEPDFYSRFSCTAQRCTDNCCIGWEIDIDENTLEKYKNTDGDIKARLEKNISFEGTPSFILDENERCPFLNGSNLCDLIISLGEDCLCDICREHPRFYEWYGDYTDCGLGLCCEEACRLLFSSEEPLKYIKSSYDKAEENGIDKLSAERIFEIRETLFEKINSRNSGSLLQRIKDCCDYVGTVQKSFACNKPCTAEELEKTVTEIMRLSEPFDKSWTDFVSSFSFKKLKDRSDISENDLERLFSYFVFRHFVKAVYDNDYITHFKLCLLLFALALLYLKANESLSKEEAVKYVSKEFEYSDSNTDLLEFECADNRLLSFENLISLTEYLL